MGWSHFYLSKPNSDGVFIGSFKKYDFVEGTSFYEFELFKNNEDKAYFSLCNHSKVYEIISENKQSWDSYVKLVCDSDDYPPREIERIDTVIKGEAELLKSGNWKMVKKAKIKCTGSDVSEIATKAEVEQIETCVQDTPQISNSDDISTKQFAEEALTYAIQEDAVCSDILESKATEAGGLMMRERVKPPAEDIRNLKGWIDDEKLYLDWDFPDESDAVRIEYSCDGDNTAPIDAGIFTKWQHILRPFTIKKQAAEKKIYRFTVYSRYIFNDEVYESKGVECSVMNVKKPSDIDDIKKETPPSYKNLPKVSKKLCPYCFSEYKIKNAPFTCPNCNNRRELPYTHRCGKSKNLYFAVVGEKNAGKSHYIAVLINTIKRRLTNTFKINLQTLDDYTWKTYAQNYYNPIFKENKFIDTKQSAPINEPLLYSLSFMKPGLFDKEKIADVNTLAFFDNDVEDLNVGETQKTKKKYKKDFVHGIILLVDTLQLPKIQGIVKKVKTLIRDEAEKRYGNPNKKIDIPIAIVLSKIDMLEDKLGEDDKFLLSNGDHNGYFNQTDARNVGDVIERLIDDSTIKVTNDFNNCKFFGISAIGSTPNKAGGIPKLRPIRVEDPFLWLLHTYKLIM